MPRHDVRPWSLRLDGANTGMVVPVLFTLSGDLFGDSWEIIGKWVGRSGVVLGGWLAMLIAVVWLRRWIVRHEVVLSQRWRAFIEQRRVAAFRDRFASQIRFLQKRLTPGGYLGLYLTIGVIVISFASWWFGAIVQDLLAHDPLIVVDETVAIWFNGQATPIVTRFGKVITFFGAPLFLGSASIGFALVLIWRRSWYSLLSLVLTMGGGMLLNFLLKSIFHRQRPVLEHPLITASGFSFPSGHTMGSTLFYLFLAFTISMLVKEWRWRVLVVLLGLMFVFVIGLTRILLGVHFLSDVLGAMAVGTAWLALCLTAVETLRRYKDESRDSA